MTRPPSSTELRIRVVQADDDRAGARRRWATPVRGRVRGVRRRRPPDRDPGRVAPTPHGGGSPATGEARGLAVGPGRGPAAPEAPRRARGQRGHAGSARPLRLATRSRGVATRPLRRNHHGSRHGTRARRRAAAARRLPPGEPRACSPSAALARRLRPPPRPGQGVGRRAAGAAGPRGHAVAAGTPGHAGGGRRPGRGGRP
jgi:hypothetical protein